jgi:hypothetical protein
MAKSNFSLVEKAKNMNSNRRSKRYEIGAEHHELFKSFAKGEINMKQACHALGSKKNTDYCYLLAIAKDMAGN